MAFRYYFAAALYLPFARAKEGISINAPQSSFADVPAIAVAWFSFLGSRYTP
jgi:hypothetical protein